ncbi:sphingomyelin phosphodiesterase 5-like [Tiliqua scincoides]|uniref:sphingomyelin phosphodiesterase 5-like n=1 Tax=Tiliqua scincoides TaxID=71010 RepID=UPI0034622C1B
MGLRESPYASRLLAGADAAARALLFPSYWLTSHLLALRKTTVEEQACRGRRGLCALEAVLQAPGLLLLLLLSAPLLLLGLLAWLPLQAARRPFAYQHTPSQAPPEEWALPGQGQRAFRFLSANVCLLPEGLAKFSNLFRTQWRAGRIAQDLARAVHPSAALPDLGLGDAPNEQTYGATEDALWRATDVAIEMPLDGAGQAPVLGEIRASFPPKADFLCLQEVFDRRAATRVRHLLGPHYAHIIYDVGTYGLVGCALKLLNSGLFLASRYPVLAVKYHCYPNGKGEDAFSAKGLLCVQVKLGSFRGQRIVGYLNCTHLQAPEGDAQIRYDQLSLSLLWAQLFQDTNGQAGDTVAFDIYCGDLNFDNCSPDDQLEQTHEIFTLYTDPCRIGPRKDKPWAIGTLTNYLKIYDKAVSTPEKMKRTLSCPEGRRKYLAGPILANGHPDLSGGWSEGRRIDYLMYREHSGPAELRTAVEKVSFITQLATCSDHLPVGLQLLVASVA